MKSKKKNFIYENQKSFFFNDFLEHSQKNKKSNKSKVNEDRLYVLFSFFFSLILIFSISIFSTSIQESNFQGYKKKNYNHLLSRRDILDRNGELMARNINSYHAIVKSDLIKNKENFILKIKLQKKILLKKKID